jgi:hypothetical protein
MKKTHFKKKRTPMRLKHITKVSRSNFDSQIETLLRAWGEIHDSEDVQAMVYQFNREEPVDVTIFFKPTGG